MSVLPALADLSMRHRRWVFAFWTAMLIVGGAFSAKAVDALSFDFSLPGQPGYETDVRIMDAYGNGGSVPPLIPVVTVPQGSTVEDNQEAVDGVFAAIQQQVPAVRVVDHAATGDSLFLGDDGRTAYALVFTPPAGGLGAGLETQVEPVLREQARLTGFDVGLTGYTVLSTGAEAEEPSVLVETLIGGLGALLVLAFVFASFLAFLPLLVAAVSITSTFLLVLLLTMVTDVSFVVQFLIALVGLGVAVDYSLLIVSRWREEQARGRTNEDAVREAVRTAGHAVVSSGVTVAISLMALVAIPVPFLRSMGYGGVLIPLVSTVVSLTLLPALLAAVGPRADWPRIRKENSLSRGWVHWSRAIIRFRVPAAVLSAGLLAALLVPLLGINVGAARTESLASSGPAYDALQTVKSGGAPAGVVTPIEVLVRGGDPGAVAAALRDVDGVAAVLAPDGPAWRQGDLAIIEVVPEQETVDSDASAVVRRIDDVARAQDEVVGAAGQGAVVLDYIKAVYGSFPIALGLIVLITYVQLVRTFRSLLLPLKAVLLNLFSVAATFGLVVLFWQYGYGSEAVFNIEPTGAITFWVPLVSFAFLFGLSMDYEVFILARMREEYDGTRSNERAITEGMGRTGRLVTSAALILFLAFVALSSAPGTDVKVFATALGLGILLDATVVRAALVPALVALLGHWNWWLPGWAGRLLRVEPSPLVRPPVGRHRKRMPGKGLHRSPEDGLRASASGPVVTAASLHRPGGGDRQGAPRVPEQNRGERGLVRR